MNHQISIIVGLSCTCNMDHWHSTWKGCNSCSTCICIQVYLLNCMSSTLGKQRFTSWSFPGLWSLGPQYFQMKAQASGKSPWGYFISTLLYCCWPYCWIWGWPHARYNFLLFWFLPYSLYVVLFLPMFWNRPYTIPFQCLMLNCWLSFKPSLMFMHVVITCSLCCGK